MIPWLPRTAYRTMEMPASETDRKASNWVGLAGLLSGLGVALLAQFAIDSLADSSQLWHWLQHGLLFTGGLLAGGCLVTLYRAGQRQV